MPNTYIRVPKKPQPQAPMGEHGSVVGRIQPGNIDLSERARLHVPNPKGGYSSVYSTSFTTPKGEVLIPQVVRIRSKWQVVSPRAAFQHYRRTGQHLGIFKDAASANRYANSLHKEQARRGGNG